MKYTLTKEAFALRASGFKSNGCGAVGSKKWLTYLLTNLLSFDLREPCECHDLEYSLPKAIKSPERKREADNNFELNLQAALKDYPEKLSPIRKAIYNNFKPYKTFVDWVIENLPRLYHAAVIAGGYNAYWS